MNRIDKINYELRITILILSILVNLFSELL